MGPTIDASLVMDALGHSWPFGMQMRHRGEPGLYSSACEFYTMWAPLENGCLGEVRPAEWGDCTFILQGGVAFVLALDLDAWELDGHPDLGWAPKLALLLWKGDPETVTKHLEAMRALIALIAYSNRIRRALWPDAVIDAGSLASMVWNGREWMFTTGGIGGKAWWFCAEPAEVEGPCYTHVPALTGITDPAEAMRAIAAEVAS